MDEEIRNFLCKFLEKNTPADWDELLSSLLLGILKHFGLIPGTQDIPHKDSYTVPFTLNNESILIGHYMLPNGALLTVSQPNTSIKVAASEVFCTPLEDLVLKKRKNLLWKDLEETIPAEWLAALRRLHATLKKIVQDNEKVAYSANKEEIPRPNPIGIKEESPPAHFNAIAPMGTRDIWPHVPNALPKPLVPDGHGGLIPGNTPIEDWSMRKPIKPEINFDPLVPLPQPAPSRHKIKPRIIDPDWIVEPDGTVGEFSGGEPGRTGKPDRIAGEPDSDEFYPPGMHMDPFY